MTYDPVVIQTKRLIQYLNGKPAPVGLGFDRWFVFLHKMGIAAYTEILIAAVPIFLLGLSFIRVRRLLIQARQDAPELHQNLVFK
jgi:hypothetical protein